MAERAPSQKPRSSARMPSRPVLRWLGGKWVLAPWIVEHLPPHREYVEPYGGAASVLLRKPRSFAETYNDLDADVVGLFRVLQDEASAARLIEKLVLTPFSRAEFELSYVRSDDPVIRAQRLVVRSFMGFGADAHNAKSPTGFRSSSRRSGTTPSHDWVRYPEALRATVERLRGVLLEQRPALEVMARNDGRETLFYVDPPYLPETRSKRGHKRGDGYCVYAHEMSTEDHRELLEFLRTLRGMVVLSGYPSALYRETLGDWQRVERKALADGARRRTEVLWFNSAAWQALRRQESLPLDARGSVLAEVSSSLPETTEGVAQ